MEIVPELVVQNIREFRKNIIVKFIYKIYVFNGTTFERGVKFEPPKPSDLKKRITDAGAKPLVKFFRWNFRLKYYLVKPRRVSKKNHHKLL